jgi:glycosyltransferase involved in cell wall biosynthesis
MRPGITAVVTTHPARLTGGLLQHALASVTRQTLQPAAIVVSNDLEREGATGGRRRALAMVQTEWLAWLDSDDYWHDDHLDKLMRVADETGAVFVFSWFDAPGDPLGHFGLPFNPATPHHTTITFLCKTELAQEVGFHAGGRDGTFSNEDWLHICGIAALAVERDLKMVHLAERTWYWRMNGQNTSGLPGQGDAQ